MESAETHHPEPHPLPSPPLEGEGEYQNHAAAAATRLSRSFVGESSSPFGQHNAPASMNTRRKNDSSRSASSKGPLRCKNSAVEVAFRSVGKHERHLKSAAVSGFD